MLKQGIPVIVLGTVFLVGCTGGSDTATTAASVGVTPAFAAAVFDVDKRALDFGTVDCGKTAQGTYVFTLTNTGTASFGFQVALSKGITSPFSVAPDAGTVAVGAKVQITVTPLPIPAVASVAGNAFADAMTITTDAPNQRPLVVPLTQSARGAIVTLAPANVDFGNVPRSAGSVTANVSISNTGNATANLNVAAQPGSPFTIDSGPTVAIEPNNTRTVTVTYTPVKNGPQTGRFTFTPSLGDVSCNATPLTLNAAGIASDGTMLVQPASLTFGENGSPYVDCDKAGTPRPVRITNTGNAPFSFTPTLSRDNSPFSLVLENEPGSGTGVFGGAPISGVPIASFGGRGADDAPPGTVQPGQTVLLTVVPKPFTRTGGRGGNDRDIDTTDGHYDDTLVITSNTLASTTVAVKLSMSARGVVLSQSNLPSFGSVGINTSETARFSWINTGNTPVFVSLANSTPAFLMPDPVLVAADGDPGSTVASSIRFAPRVLGAASDNVSIRLAVSPTNPARPPVCSAPDSFTVDGTGVAFSGARLAASPDALDFGDVVCGTLTEPRSFTVVNNASEATRFTARLRRGALSPFLVAVDDPNTGPPASLLGDVPIGPGAAVTLRVFPLDIPGRAATGRNAFGDTLDIIPPDGPAPSVTLSESAIGNDLSFVDATNGAIKDNALSFAGASTVTRTFRIANAGSAPATYAFTLVDPTTGREDPGNFRIVQGAELSLPGASGGTVFSNDFTIAWIAPPAVDAGAPSDGGTSTASDASVRPEGRQLRLTALGGACAPTTALDLTR